MASDEQYYLLQHVVASADLLGDIFHVLGVSFFRCLLHYPVSEVFSRVLVFSSLGSLGWRLARLAVQRTLRSQFIMG